MVTQGRPMDECWACDTTENIVYTDVLGLGWCQKHFDEIYLNDLDGDLLDGD